MMVYLEQKDGFDLNFFSKVTVNAVRTSGVPRRQIYDVKDILNIKMFEE